MPSYNKNSKGMKTPTLAAEFTAVSLNLMFVKFYKDDLFNAMSFFAVLIPVMAYLIITLFGNLLKFIQLMHMEDSGDDGSVLTVKQRKILIKVFRNLLGYFGLYFLSQQLDKFIKVEDLDKINLLPAFIGLNIAFGIQIYLNYARKQEIKAKNKADDIESGSASLLSATGLTTLFNALTQTTTTLCANG